MIGIGDEELTEKFKALADLWDSGYNQAISDMTSVLKSYFGDEGFKNLESLHPKIEALKKPLQGHAK